MLAPWQMMIRVRNQSTSSRDFADRWLSGGLLHVRRWRPTVRVPVEYARALTGRRRRRPYVGRLWFRARRLVNLYDSPVLHLTNERRSAGRGWLARAIGGGVNHVRRWSPTVGDHLRRRYAALLDLTSVAVGSRQISWSMTGRVRFQVWASTQCGTLSRWPLVHRGSKTVNSLVKWFNFSDRQPAAIAAGRFSSRRRQLQGLLRRRRHLLLDQLRLTHHREEYLRYHYGKRRRKLRAAARRYYRVRSRRIRAYRQRLFTVQTYLRGLTKVAYQKIKASRISLLERARLLTGEIPYYEVIGRWFDLTLNQRVGHPLEYNYLKPGIGYHRIIKKRLERSRRWKLLQHPRWSYWFRLVETERRAWFE